MNVIYSNRVEKGGNADCSLGNSNRPLHIASQYRLAYLATRVIYRSFVVGVNCMSCFCCLARLTFTPWLLQPFILIDTCFEYCCPIKHTLYPLACWLARRLVVGWLVGWLVVGRLRDTPFGLYIAGESVYKWCIDWYHCNTRCVSLCACGNRRGRKRGLNSFRWIYTFMHTHTGTNTKPCGVHWSLDCELNHWLNLKLELNFDLLIKFQSIK